MGKPQPLIYTDTIIEVHLFDFSQEYLWANDREWNSAIRFEMR